MKRIIKTFTIVLMNLKIVLFHISCIFLNGCIAITTTQSGRTVGKYNAEIGANVTAGKYDLLSEPFPEANYYPIGEINACFGVAERLDVGIKANTSAYISGNSKFQFLGNKKSLFAAGTGFEAGFNPVVSLLGRTPYYITAPLFLSVHPTKSTALYFTPRYNFSGFYTLAHESNPSRVGEHITFQTWGSSYGLIFGQKHKIILEASSFDNNFFAPTQYAIGYRYFIPFTELLPGGRLF